ncbi:hypothetical protein FA95DRAFT_1611153 [Auriscalpium vulgare]|uniref:Uncharacterized protein n=1 Tax=Auriscalpium vulgare TaxID=40419 RepID=A0ACB8RAT9_9AGAM|nr:hypothetical protein FA95DRAFT_1611153 [Auriscalpium vulgare]
MRPPFAPTRKNGMPLGACGQLSDVPPPQHLPFVDSMDDIAPQEPIESHNWDSESTVSDSSAESEEAEYFVIRGGGIFDSSRRARRALVGTAHREYQAFTDIGAAFDRWLFWEYPELLAVAMARSAARAASQEQVDNSPAPPHYESPPPSYLSSPSSSVSELVFADPFPSPPSPPLVPLPLELRTAPLATAGERLEIEPSVDEDSDRSDSEPSSDEDSDGSGWLAGPACRIDAPYFAVKRGRRVGVSVGPFENIYRNVVDFPGAYFKACDSMIDGLNWLESASQVEAGDL